MDSSATAAVAVYGATGHTGRFILSGLARRGMRAVAVGRRGPTIHGAPSRVAAVHDPAALAGAFAGCRVVINAAGPFLDTAAPVARAALAAGCHYIDLTAEQESARATLRDFDQPARERGLLVVPAAGFFGGLADLLASALMDHHDPDATIDVAIHLDHWWPTQGTRLTGARNSFPRMVVEDGRLVPMELPPPGTSWDFGPSLGTVEMQGVPLSEMVTLSHHLPARRIRTWLSANALDDLRDPHVPAPAAVDSLGRSAQCFTMQVVVVDARGRRCATARGRDIYAVSAPLAIVAAARLMDSRPERTGAHSLGSAFPPRELLSELAPAEFEATLDG